LSILNITEYFQLSSYSTKESIQKTKLSFQSFDLKNVWLVILGKNLNVDFYQYHWGWNLKQ